MIIDTEFFKQSLANFWNSDWFAPSFC